MKKYILLSILLLSALFLQGQSRRWEEVKRVDTNLISITDPRDFSQARLVDNEAGFLYLLNLVVAEAEAEGRRYRDWQLQKRNTIEANKYMGVIFPTSDGWQNLFQASQELHNGRFADTTNLQRYESTISFNTGSIDTSFNVNIFENSNNGRPIMRIEGDTTNTNYPVNFVASDRELRVGSQNRKVPILDSFIAFYRVPTNRERQGILTFFGETLDGRLARFIWKTRLTLE